MKTERKEGEDRGTITIRGNENLIFCYDVIGYLRQMHNREIIQRIVINYQNLLLQRFYLEVDVVLFGSMFGRAVFLSAKFVYLSFIHLEILAQCAFQTNKGH